MSDLPLWTFFVFDHIWLRWRIYFSVRLTIKMSTIAIERRWPFPAASSAGVDSTLSARPFLLRLHPFRLQPPSMGRVSCIQRATINLSTFGFSPSERNWRVFLVFTFAASPTINLSTFGLSRFGVPLWICELNHQFVHFSPSTCPLITIDLSTSHHQCVHLTCRNPLFYKSILRL